MPFYDFQLERDRLKSAPRRYLRLIRVTDCDCSRHPNSPKVLSRILLYMMALDFLCTILCVMAWWRRRNSRSLCVDSMEADRRSGNVKGPPSATAKSIEKGVISRKGEIFPSDKILLLGPRLIFASLHCSRKCRTITLWCKFIPPPSAKTKLFYACTTKERMRVGGGGGDKVSNLRLLFFSVPRFLSLWIPSVS